MKQVITKSFLFLILFTTINCGFKVISESEKNNFSIKEIKTSGDKRINFKIKNNLLNSAKKIDQNTLVINLNTKKTKNIKEKNIKNEITKYSLKIQAKVELQEIGKGKLSKFIVADTMDYEVAKHHSKTLDNEKKIIDLIIENIADKILNNIRNELDAI